MIDTEIQHDHFKEIYSVWGYGYKVPSLKMKLSSPCLAVIFLGSIPVIIAKIEWAFLSHPGSEEQHFSIVLSHSESL